MYLLVYKTMAKTGERESDKMKNRKSGNKNPKNITGKSLRALEASIMKKKNTVLAILLLGWLLCHQNAIGMLC